MITLKSIKDLLKLKLSIELMVMVTSNLKYIKSSILREQAQLVNQILLEV